MPSTSASALLGLGRPVYEVFDYTGSSQTWTKPTGVDYIEEIIIIGAGGGGMAGNNSTSYGGVGGAGGQIRRFQNILVEDDLTITIGAAGTGGSGSDHAAGTSGGDTTVTDGTTTWTAYGGDASSVWNQQAVGGGKIAYTETGAGSFGGATGGDGAIYNADGEMCPGFSPGGARGTGSNALQTGGGGGGSYDSGGDGGSDSGGNGSNASGIGGGGGGGGTDGASTRGNGGNGAPGRVIIKYRR